MTPAELTALVRAVAADGLPGSQAATPNQPLDPAAWHRLLGEVNRERITPLLARGITNGSFPATDAQTTQALGLTTDALVAVLTLEATLLRVATTLERAAISIRVLKGPAVAHLDYPDASLRDFGDIDLLIRSDDFDRAIGILQEQGYVRRFPEPRAGFDRRFTKSVSLVSNDGQELDLHRTLAPGLFGMRVIVETLWDSPPQQFVLGGVMLPALGPAQRFLHACYHAALGNTPPRLVPQRDIAQMLLAGSVDADQVQTLAAAWRGEAVVKYAIATTWATLQLTDGVAALSSWAANHQSGPRQQRELARATSPAYSYAAQALDSIRAIRTVRGRLDYVSALAFPRRSYLSGRHAGRTSRVGHAFSDLLAARAAGPQLTRLPTSNAKENSD